jgi:outer membrane protein
MTDSRLGKQEQASFDSLKEQMSSLLEDTEKQINEIAAKFNDSEYMDGLSPEAEEEMQNKYRMLSEEMGRYQNQYYQVMQQANMKVMQVVSASIQEASEKVAKDKKLNMVMSKETCFFTAPTLDVTNFVVAEMDKAYEQHQSANKTEAAK